MLNNLLIFGLIMMANVSLCQNIIEKVEVKESSFSFKLDITLCDGEIIELETRFSSEDIKAINFYGDENFILVLIEPIVSHNGEYFINGAFKSKEGWVHDYRDRSFAKYSTSLSDTQITSIDIYDAQTLKISYETTMFNDQHIEVNTKLFLGKHAFHEESTKENSNFTLYAKGSILKRQVEKSLRKDYMNLNEIEEVSKAPPKRENQQSSIQLEIDSLQRARTKKVENLIAGISETCDISRNDSIIISIKIIPNGEITFVDIRKSKSIVDHKVKCIEYLISNSENLGIIKVVPNARIGFKPQPILYNFPLGVGVSN